jgi:integrase
MPKKSQASIATDREVAGAKRPAAKGARAEYRIAGSPNLVLRVTCEGKRSWVYWIKRPKTLRWQKYTIGSYPAVTLALARQEAVRLKRLVIEGTDPIDARIRARDALTVKVLGEKYITRHARPKKRSWQEDERKLKREVDPKIGSLIAEQVAKSDIVSLLDEIRDRGAPIQANRVLALLRKLFNWAVAEGYLQSSPASRIPARSVERVRTRILDRDELRSFWLALNAFDEVTADVLRAQLLLGARVREITGMAKSELTLHAAIPTWTLPKDRAKGNRDVVRPLPPASLAIIRRRLAASQGTNPNVFASAVECVGGAITARAPARAVQRASARNLVPKGFTPHDLRRTCRTGLAALGVPEIVAKKILGHAPPRSDVTASVYDQHTYVSEMMDALQRWEAHVMRIVHEPEQSVAA